MNALTNVKYFKSPCGLASASITTHRDGTATLKISCGVQRVLNKKYKSYKSAYNAWWRYND